MGCKKRDSLRDEADDRSLYPHRRLSSKKVTNDLDDITEEVVSKILDKKNRRHIK